MNDNASRGTKPTRDDRKKETTQEAEAGEGQSYLTGYTGGIRSTGSTGHHGLVRDGCDTHEEGSKGDGGYYSFTLYASRKRDARDCRGDDVLMKMVRGNSE